MWGWLPTKPGRVAPGLAVDPAVRKAVQVVGQAGREEVGRAVALTSKAPAADQ